MKMQASAEDINRRRARLVRRVKLRCLRDAILLSEIGLRDHDAVRKLGEIRLDLDRLIETLAPSAAPRATEAPKT